MPYRLRPANKLKTPGWRKKELESGGKTVNPREVNKIPTHDNGSERPPDETDGPYSLFQSPLTSNPISSPPTSSPTGTPTHLSPSTKRPKMAPVKRIPTRNAPADPTERPFRGKATDRGAAVTADPLANNETRVLMAAAFPSLLTTAPTSELTDAHVAVKKRLQALEEDQDELLEATFRTIDSLYEVKRFPADLPEEQKAWYTELLTRWLPGEENVPEVTFRSIYPSVRQSIISQFHDMYPEKTFLPGRHYPARRLLGLSTTEFKKIMAEDSSVWDDDVIPEHIRDFQRRYPGKAVDPDLPPPHEVVKAIRWLKQEHFPGSLLGKWQFPLPEISAFVPPFPDSDEDEVAEFPSILSDISTIDIDRAALAPNNGYNAERPNVVGFHDWQETLIKIENENETVKENNRKKQEKKDAKRLKNILYPKRSAGKAPIWPNYAPQAALPAQHNPSSYPKTLKKNPEHPGIKPHARAINKIHKELGFEFLYLSQSYGFDLPSASIIYPNITNSHLANVTVYASRVDQSVPDIPYSPLDIARLPSSGAAYAQRQAFNPHAPPPSLSKLQEAADKRTGPVAYPSVGAFKFRDETGPWRESMFDGLPEDSEPEDVTGVREAEIAAAAQLERDEAEEQRPRKRRGGGKVRFSDPSTSLSSQPRQTTSAYLPSAPVPTIERDHPPTTAQPPAAAAPLEPLPPKRKRGRPRKNTSSTSTSPPNAPPAPKRKRGRPPKRSPPSVESQSPPTPPAILPTAGPITINSAQEANQLLRAMTPREVGGDRNPLQETQGKVENGSGVISVSSVKDLTEALLRRSG